MQTFTLTNSAGYQLMLCDRGARIIELRVPDRQGRVENVVLRHPDLSDYLSDDLYLGCIAGRYAGRIANASFTLDAPVELAANDGPHHLHGGISGFDQQLWTHRASSGDSQTFELLSCDGDQHYPGELRLQVTYQLTDDRVTISYEATTTATTVINLTNHSYFNLAGPRSTTVLNHHLQVNADSFLELAGDLIPTGAVLPVSGCAMDLCQRIPIGLHFNGPDPQLALAGGYDHTWVINGANGIDSKHAATLVEPECGRVMEVWTTEPGLQVYSGNFLGDGEDTRFSRHQAVCLETQHFPNSPNTPHFPSTTLAAGERYISQTSYRFLVD